jgi:sugar phosphate isomerase/epimerase
LTSVRELGFENLEFNMKCVEKGNEDSVFTAKELIDSNGLNCLTVHAATLHVKDESEIATAVYYGRVSADFAYKLSAPVLVVHSNVSRKLLENVRNRFLAKIFAELNRYAKRLNLKLSLENLSYASSGYGKNVAELEEILSVVDEGSMGITLDFCHAEATGQTISLLEKYKNRLCNIHMSNRAHQPFDMETPNLNYFLTKLREYGYSGPLTMELSSKCSTEAILKTKTIIEKTLKKLS